MNTDEREAMRGQAEEHPPYLTISPDKLLGLLDALDAAEQRNGRLEEELRDMIDWRKNNGGFRCS